MAAARNLALGLLLWLCLGGAAQAQGPWSGGWMTNWPDGGARLILDQQGERVSGTYPLYGGVVEARATGRVLEGSWTEGGRTGRFVFVLSRDGDSFSGRYDDGEWWTGERQETEAAPINLPLTTPRDAFRHFIVSGNLARAGRPDAWGTALLSVTFSDEMATAARAEQLRHVQELFALTDLTTFRIFSLPDAPTGNMLEFRLEQSNSDAALTLTMMRDAAGDWRIRMPDREALIAARTALLAARGGRLPAADAFERLQNPRDTMRAFLEGMSRWGGSGRALALSSLDLSHIPDALRESQGPLMAHYLRRVIDQIGLIGLQSIPDDGTNRSPYLHFNHPAGRIIIAPSGAEAGASWQFTSQSVADAPRLFLALEGLPPPLATPPGLIPDAPFFTLRDAIRRQAPALLDRLGTLEYWQILGILLLLGSAILLGGLGSWVIRRVITPWAAGKPRQDRAFAWSSGIVIGLLLASQFTIVLGLPEEIRRFSYPFFGSAITLASTVVAWHLLGIGGGVLQRLSDRTDVATDDILFTLILATARLGVVVAGLLSVAYFLSIPTGGILAGLGIGGLAFAFASRETLSNVFGAGILVADRPFRRGDWIKSGDIEGAVEHVGIRSTRVRTAQDSLMIVPNGRLSDSTINNLGTRRHRQLKTQFLVTSGGTPESVDSFAAAILDRIRQDETFVGTRTEIGVCGITAGGVEVELSTYLIAATSAAEREARHRLLLDVARLAAGQGLKLGPGLSPELAPAGAADPAARDGA